MGNRSTDLPEALSSAESAAMRLDECVSARGVLRRDLASPTSPGVTAFTQPEMLRFTL